jgi:hypothetical protein
MGLLVCALAVVFIASAPSQAVVVSTYTLDRWEHGPSAHFKIDPNFDVTIRNSTGNTGVSGATGEVRASKDEWNNRSPFTFIETGWNDTIGGRVRAQDLGVRGSLLQPDCVNGGNIAIVCTTKRSTSTGVYLNEIETVFNSLRFRFTTNRQPFRLSDGTMVYSVYNIGRHEFGHWPSLRDEYGLSNGERTSTMYDWDQILGGGDLRGVTQLYGPYTGWDSWRADGIHYPADLAYYGSGRRAVADYYNNANTAPELSPVYASTETIYNNIQPYYGERMERFAGTSRDPYSYAYYSVFSRQDDKSGTGSTRIKAGQVLKWCQYNYQQTTMSVDAVMTDSYNLRDDPRIVDQNGVRIHPAYRNYPTGQWHCFSFDLTPAAGKEVAFWQIAYDNANTRWVGQFRAYFDSLKLVWPGGPKQ